MAQMNWNEIPPERLAEMVAHLRTAPLPAKPFMRFISNPSGYDPVQEFHFEHCGCDECGAYRRVGIG